MNWVEYRIHETKEQHLPKLELVDDSGWRRSDPVQLPQEVFELTHLTSLTLEGIALPINFHRIVELTKLEELRLHWCKGGPLSLELQELQTLKVLALTGMHLSSIPFDIARLHQLEELDLSYNRLVDLPISLKSLRNLTTLNVTGNNFTSPPRVLTKLKSLKRISFGSTGEKARISGALFIETVKYLDDLKALTMQGLRLDDADIQRISGLSGLEEIDIWQGLDDFPVRLARLPRLAELSIYTEKPLRIPDAIVDFQALRKLSVSTWRVREKQAQPRPSVSKHLLDLVKLEELSLSDRDVDNISDELPQLASLKRLSLTACGIRDFPLTIGALTNLRDLNLSSNAISKLPQSLFTLHALEGLWLYTAGDIKTVSDDIARLSELRRLSLAGCGLTGFPKGIVELTKLEVLQLGGNLLEKVPAAIASMVQLQVVRLNGNQVKEIPKELAMLPRLRVLEVDDNPIQSPPPEILAQGINGIRSYFDALVDADVERLYEAKLLVVGEGAVGKTCLAQKLIEPNSDLSGRIRSTEGIEIRTWDIVTPQTDHFRINLWDFGGQEIYHATHQFFLTQRSLYLFVWDARKEDRTGGFDYWLNVIRLLSAGSPVIVVLNKADERIREIDEADLKKHFDNIEEFHKVSALKGTGIEALRGKIMESVAALPHVGDKWPVTWGRIRRALEKNPRDYISREEYEGFCEEEALPSSQMNSLASYLHDLGVILHFQDDPVLQRLVILKAEWGTNAVYKVLDTRKVQDAKGQFTLNDLSEIWGNEKYPPSKHAELLHLMMKFELCFPLGDSGVFVAPELLSAETPPLDWNTENNLVFEYHYPFMPAGIITRFIARIHNIIEGDKYWRNGVVLARPGARALVVAEPLNRRIRIALSGSKRRDLLAVIRHQIDEIHGTLNDPKVNEMVPCICSQCRKGPPHLFLYRTLEAYMARGIEEIRCEQSLENVQIRELLAEVFRPSGANIALSEGKPVYMIERVEHFYTSNEPSMKSSNRTISPTNNPWISGSFYLFAVLIVVAMLMAVGKVLSPWWLPVVILGGILLTTVTGAFQLRNDDRLREQGFLSLMKMAFQQIPLLGKLTKTGKR